MATLAHPSLTNSQGVRYSPRFAAKRRPGLFARAATTLRRWLRNARERQELALLSERELRDIRLSTADVWHETRQPFWRPTRPY
jgi:uncharacterized protein YjiS (DUF1127 family)